jgi:RHS repeat-associated protein
MQRVALVETRTKGDEPGVPQQLIRYQLGNHLESASLELDDQGDIISYEEYTPYGSTSYMAAKTAKRFRYSSKERDEENGLCYHGARYYAPWIGRWSQPDPHKENYFDISPYVFTLGNPIRLTDPNGEDVYILYYTEGNKRGDEMFKAAAYTRKVDIESSSGFDKSKDIVVLSPIKDLAKLKGEVKKTVDTYSPKYGKTKEFSIWSHAGTDGPTGTVATSADALDKKQMTVSGWSKIDFNWIKDGEGANANFFGCRTGVNSTSGGGCSASKEVPGTSFAARISSQSNFKNVEVAGQTSSSFPSQYTNIRVNSENGADNFINWETDERVNFQITYMVAGTRRSDDWDGNEQNNAYQMQINKNGKTIAQRYQEGKKGRFVKSEREKRNEQDWRQFKRALAGDTGASIYIMGRFMNMGW